MNEVQKDFDTNLCLFFTWKEIHKKQMSLSSHDKQRTDRHLSVSWDFDSITDSITTILMAGGATPRPQFSAIYPRQPMWPSKLPRVPVFFQSQWVYDAIGVHSISDLFVPDSSGKSLATYGLVAGMLVTYLFEWKAVAQYLPIYNTKYKKDQ